MQNVGLVYSAAGPRSNRDTGGCLPKVEGEGYRFTGSWTGHGTRASRAAGTGDSHLMDATSSQDRTGQDGARPATRGRTAEQGRAGRWCKRCLRALSAGWYCRGGEGKEGAASCLGSNYITTSGPPSLRCYTQPARIVRP